ncbi:dipeptidase PepV [Vagococcus humatus]|uniref:Dipeptidase PepV n=1 Tax=Vagococcus humatus TaxID=1889241 RepID=A0A3S0ABE9_9ENTE|nr:dipeptidase PepV [Vagococcus humatus]RST88951.1 dipeptidase PepV [Vagococcus humatus]
MTTINWEKEVDSRKDQLMKDLDDLLRIDSVKDLANKSDEFPVGPGPTKALQKFLEFGERDGFVTKNIENVAGHIEFGDGDETFGILGHVDVVPVGDGWETDPFVPVIKDGKLYARGSSDDKGPVMAAYYGLKIIKELGLPVSKKVRFIVGADEESGWYCMDRYRASETMPDFGFSPDAQFPIINGEKGIASYILSFPDVPKKDGDYVLEEMNSGIAANMVPGDATVKVTVKNGDINEMKAAFEKYIADNKLGGEAQIDGQVITIKLVGKQAHAQNPKAGINSATHLCNFLSDYAFDGKDAAYINNTAKFLHDDYQGKKVGIDHVDETMGELTSSPNMFRYGLGDEPTILTNVRFPKGSGVDKIVEQVKAHVTEAHVEAAPGAQDPHYTPVTDPMVKTFLDTYEKYTGEKGVEKTIGGGTYARLFERGCAYGALFPGREDVMHQANEYMYVEDIYKAAVIYADAIYQLIK